MKRIFRNGVFIFLCGGIIFFQGCMAMGMYGTLAFQKLGGRESNAYYKKEHARKLKLYEEMKENNNPEGDYLYAMADADGWLKNNSNSEETISLLEKASDNGSSDAKIELGLYYFSGRRFGASLHNVLPLSYEQIDKKRGMKLFLEGYFRDCTLIQNISKERGKFCLVRYSAAGRMAVLYRDGVYAWNRDQKQVPIIEKNDEKYRYWRELGRRCVLERIPKYKPECFLVN